MRRSGSTSSRGGPAEARAKWVAKTSSASASAPGDARTRSASQRRLKARTYSPGSKARNVELKTTYDYTVFEDRVKAVPGVAKVCRAKLKESGTHYAPYFLEVYSSEMPSRPIHMELTQHGHVKNTTNCTAMYRDPPQGLEDEADRILRAAVAGWELEPPAGSYGPAPGGPSPSSPPPRSVSPGCPMSPITPAEEPTEQPPEPLPPWRHAQAPLQPPAPPMLQVSPQPAWVQPQAPPMPLGQPLAPVQPSPAQPLPDLPPLDRQLVAFVSMKRLTQEEQVHLGVDMPAEAAAEQAKRVTFELKPEVSTYVVSAQRDLQETEHKEAFEVVDAQEDVQRAMATPAPGGVRSSDVERDGEVYAAASSEEEAGEEEIGPMEISSISSASEGQEADEDAPNWDREVQCKSAVCSGDGAECVWGCS